MAKRQYKGTLRTPRGVPQDVDLVLEDPEPIVKTFADGDATPSVLGGNIFKTANTSPTTITDLDDGRVGQEVDIIIDDANTTIDFTGTNLTNDQGADWSPSSGDHMRCIYDGATWYCAAWDVAGASGANELNDLTDVSITSSATGDLLRYNGTSYVDYPDSNYAAASHNHAASNVTSGTFANARIAQGNVTQHQAALTITESQISDLQGYLLNVVEDTTPQLGGNLDCQGNDVDDANIKDYSIEHEVLAESTADAVDIDFTAGNSKELDLDDPDFSGSTITVTVSNPPASGNYGEFTLLIRQASSARTISWPASFTWPGGTAPTLSTANNAIDIVHGYTVDGGTTFFCTFAQDFS